MGHSGGPQAAALGQQVCRRQRAGNRRRGVACLERARGGENCAASFCGSSRSSNACSSGQNVTKRQLHTGTVGHAARVAYSLQLSPCFVRFLHLVSPLRLGPGEAAGSAFGSKNGGPGPCILLSLASKLYGLQEAENGGCTQGTVGWRGSCCRGSCSRFLRE